MKTANQLLKYIDYYVYEPKREKVLIVLDDNAEDAKNLYNDIYNYLKRNLDDNENLKWHFDIALDCIRQMSTDDRKYIKNNPFTVMYHFGYGMYIRNQYIYSSKNHDYFMADDESGVIIEIIFTILHPHYDLTNELLTDYYQCFDYKDLYDLYYEEYSETFTMIEESLADNKLESNGIKPIDFLKEKLKTLLGKEKFIDIIVSTYLSFVEKNNINRNNIKDYLDEIKKQCILFKLEFNQFNALVDIGLYFDMRIHELNTINKIFEYIDSNLGLKEQDAYFMANCFLSIYNK